MIIDGSQIRGLRHGFVLDASHSLLRGLIISGFSVGVSVPALDTSRNPVVGDLIQGNSIGDYFTYPVDTDTGTALPSPDNVEFVRAGNAQQGVVLNSSNTTVGGSNPQENNIICGNGAQGILVQPGASGNQILGNQIGMAGPSINGLYVQDGNGAEGVLIESSGSLANPLSIVYASSNFVGSATGGNVISGNTGAGVQLVGVGAIRNLIQGNYIGVAPRGGYKFGTGDPGNRRRRRPDRGWLSEPDRRHQLSPWQHDCLESWSRHLHHGPGDRQRRCEQHDRRDRRRIASPGQLVGRGRRLFAQQHDRAGQRDLAKPPRDRDLRSGRQHSWNR